MDKEIINGRIEKLKQLDSESKPLWGKMSAQHMIEHLILAVRCGNGSLYVDCKTPSEKLAVLKRFLFSERPFPKNYINPAIGAMLIPLELANISVAIESLYAETEKFFDYFNNNLDGKLTNPTYGDLNFEEWIQFHKRHFDHHLTQFDVI